MRRRSGRGRAAPCSLRGEEGFATAEFAVALPAVMLVLALVIGTLQAIVTHHRALHAASVGARVAARGEPESAVVQVATRTGPRGSVVRTKTTADLVTVRVSPHVPDAVAWAVPDLSAEVAALPEKQFAAGDDGP